MLIIWKDKRYAVRTGLSMESRLSDIICSGFGQIYDSKVCWQFLNLRRINLRNVHKVYRFSYKCRGKASIWEVLILSILYLLTSLSGGASEPLLVAG